ncbi:MAG: hypothetical protein GY830_05625 [Bacteroidetes bacterium]|nr:hypothetical protein [Bacteroidota bacterium]
MQIKIKKMQKQYKSILSKLLLSTLFLFNAKADVEKYNLATDVADHYIKSFTIKKDDEEIGPEKTELKSYQTGKIEIDEATKRKVSLAKILGTSKQHEELQKNMDKILNSYSWDDLKLFYGTTSNPGYHLISKINKTITNIGESVLATMIVTPSSNINFLKERQKIIQTFIAKSEESKKLRKSLQKYKDSEDSILSFWTKREPLYSKEYNDYMNKKFYYANKKTNKSAGSLQFSKLFFRDWWDIFSGPLFPLELFLGFNFFAGIGGMADDTKKMFNQDILPVFYPFYNIYHPYEMSDRHYSKRQNEDIKHGIKKSNIKKPEIPTSAVVAASLITLYWVWGCYRSYNTYKEYSSVLKNLAFRLADIQAFLKSAQEISDIIKSSPELEKLYGSRLQNLRKLLAVDKKAPKSELGRLVGYLKTMPLTSWSYFFNNAGKLLASYKLFIEHKDKFKDAFYDYGRIDSFLSFSKLFEEAETYDKKNKFVYAKFISRKDRSKPYIKLKNMWNPFLDAKKAVGNNLEMDGAPGGIRNIILTGPNAGGKSTFVTGATNAILLAHVVGIAPAKEITLTPFDKINTYIDIVDDIAAGKSLFMAEVDRAQSHIKMLKKLRRDQFSFTIFDEPFSGTNPLEGGAAEYSILESIGGYSNSLTIVATHYPIVMLLEKNAKDKGFANFKVFIKPTTIEGNKRKINYTYKVVRGKSNQAIAIDILEAEGYDTKMLKRARDIILNPSKYQSSF